MAREYEKDSGGNRDADGMRDMIVLQRIGDAKETRLTYRTFGEDADSPYLFATKVAKMAADKSEKGVKALADWYGSWVYGEDLKARQKGKQGGPSEPLVPLGPKEVLNLVTGQVHNREDLKVVIPGQDWPLADRIEYINAVSVQARLARNSARE